jgi:glucosamine-phosphate N-acetyltransferase
MNEFTVRNIETSDYTKYYLQLLEQHFTIDVHTLSYTNFTEYVNNLHNYHQLFVIENTNKNTTVIIGSVTIFIETKLIHNFGKVAHVEDVIVDNTCRGKGLGKMLVQKCIDYAQKHDCYKIILNCSDENIPFYEKCGFSKKENEMALYFQR